MTVNLTIIDNSRPLDLICMGRVAVDLYAEQIHSPLENAQSFRKYLGGSAGNTAIGASRLGLNSAMFSCVGTDDMGVYLRQFLESEGVNTSLLRNTPNHLTALVLLGVSPPERFPLIFYRENCADMQIKIEDIKPEIFRQAKSLLITGTGISTPEMRKTTLEAVKVAKSSGCAVILDIDYRPVLWGLTDAGDGETRFVTSEKVTKELQFFLSELDLIVGTEEEIKICAGFSKKNNKETIEGYISRIRKQTNATIVLKKGEEGCEIYIPDSKIPISSRSFKIKVLNVLGAGDAFMSGFLRGWLREKSLEICALYGNACGALVVTRHGCSSSSPSFEEIDYFINNFDNIQDLAHHPKMNLMHLRTELGPPRKKRMFVIALDEQIPFEIFCEKNGVSFDQISVFKEEVFKGLKDTLKLIKNIDLAILIDLKYGNNILLNSDSTLFTIGVTTEESDPFQLDWRTDESLYQKILVRPSTWIVKVVCNYDLESNSMDKKKLLEKLSKLNGICISLKRKLMIELTIPKNTKNYLSSESINNQNSNSKKLRNAISEIYKAGINPFLWGIVTPKNEEDNKKLSDTLNQFDQEVGIIFQGETISIEHIEHFFKLTNNSIYNCGFKVGSNLFWEYWGKFIHGKIEKSEISKKITKKSQKLINIYIKK